jgi:hypothetical protein
VCSFEDITKSIGRGSSIFSLFILTMKLLVQGDRHRQRTKKYVLDSKSDYNFCIVNEKIGSEVMIISNALLTVELPDGPNTELQVLTLIIILGVRMDLFKTAIIASQRALFLTNGANEYRDSCLAVANTLCDLLIQAGITDENQVCVLIMFITRLVAEQSGTLTKATSSETKKNVH